MVSAYFLNNYFLSKIKMSHFNADFSENYYSGHLSVFPRLIHHVFKKKSLFDFSISISVAFCSLLHYCLKFAYLLKCCLFFLLLYVELK